MMPREKGGVVDSRLNVYGTDGLKVAGAYYQLLTLAAMSGSPARLLDLSIAPGNVSTVSAYFPPYMIYGELKTIVRTLIRLQL